LTDRKFDHASAVTVSSRYDELRDEKAPSRIVDAGRRSVCEAPELGISFVVRGLLSIAHG